MDIVLKNGKYFFKHEELLFKMKGINHFTNHPGIDRLTKVDEYFECCKSKYKSEEEWMHDNAGLLKRLGFNTVGAFSKFCPDGLYKTDIIYLSGNKYDSSKPSSDFFSGEWRAFVEKTVRIQLPGKSMIYIENEMKTGKDWRGISATLVTGYLNMGSSCPGKKAVIGFVRHVLHGRLCFWSAVCLKRFRSWNEALEYVNYKRVMFLEDKIIEFIMRKFYRTCKNIVKAQDRGVLIGGSRLLSWFTPPGALRACAKYSDYISVNYYWAKFYLHNLIPAFLRYVIPSGGLKRYYKISGKPVYITEFGFIGENGYNRNKHPYIYKKYANQKSRTRALAKFLKSVNKDWIIGLDVFEFVDQPHNGRELSDSEDNNFGIINRQGIVYNEFTEKLKEFFDKF